MATAGPRKKLGPQGPKGDKPAHEWVGSRIRFENPDGSWGDFENLKGPKGNDGKPGKDGIHGARGIPGVGVPNGGAEGQVLTKFSGGDYDTYWTDPGTGGAATSAPKLIATFTTDVSTAVGDLVRVVAEDTVEAITDNLATTIPNGIFGVVTGKPSSVLAQVIFIGIQGGYSGFTVGQPLLFNQMEPLGTPSRPSERLGKWFNKSGLLFQRQSSLFIYKLLISELKNNPQGDIMDTTLIENKTLTPTKRGRGRPRKNPVVAYVTPKSVFEVISEASEPVKRGRGRPKKNKNTSVKNVTKLTRDEFWKFHALSAELALVEEKAKTIAIAIKNLEAEAEMVKVKMLNLKGPASDLARKNIEDAKTAFQTFKDEIEGKIGVSLNGASIDEKTLVVKASTSPA